MSAQLNRRPDWDWDFDEIQQPINPSSTFEDFEEPVLDNKRRDELLFFAQLFVFTIATVLSAFLLLSLNLSSILALPIAVVVSAMLTKLTQLILSHYLFP